jgi:hypothetical protein
VTAVDVEDGALEGQDTATHEDQGAEAAKEVPRAAAGEAAAAAAAPGDPLHAPHGVLQGV